MTEHGETMNRGLTKTSGRHRRRWPYVLAAVVIVIALLVFVLPYLVSTSRGTHVLLNYVNAHIRGTVQVRDLSLSWKGPTALHGVELTDPEGRKVLEAKEITWAKGVWSAATSAVQFKHITVDSPKTVLYFDGNGEPSISRAVDTRGPTQPSTTSQPASALPKPVGRITIQGANVLMVRPNGKQYRIDSINGQFDLDTLSRVKGTLTAKLPDQSQVDSDINMHNLVTNDEFSLDQTAGTIRLTTTGGVDLHPLAVFAFDNPNVGGKMNLKLDADIQSGKTRADFNTQIAGLRAGRTGQEKVKPIDLNAVGELRTSSDKMTAQATIAGHPGKIAANLSYTPSKQATSLSQEDFVGLILRGERHPLPEFSLTSDGSFDIPTLARAIPAILTLRPGVEITNGRFIVDHVRVQGGEKPSATGTVQLTEVSAVRAGKGIRLAPIVSTFDLLIEQGRGLVIRKGALNSGFLDVQAKGILSNLDADFRGDLAGINRFGEVFQLFSTDTAGTIAGKLNLRQPQPDRLDMALDMTTQGFHYAGDPGRLAVQDAKVTYNGYLELENRKVRRLAANQVLATIDNRVQTTGSGWYDPNRGRLHTEFALQQADLGYMTDRVSQLQGKPPSQMAGTLWATARMDRESEDDPLRIAGDGRIERFQTGTGSDAYSDNLITFSADRVLVSPQRQTVSLGNLALSSTPLTLQASGRVDQYSTQRVVDFQGTYSASWDRITALLHQMVPATTPIVSVSGRGSSDFRIAGPMAGSIMRGFRANCGMNWPAGVLYGLALGQTGISPSIRDGRLFLPVEPIPASNGLLLLGGFIDFMPKHPVLQIPGSLALLENIRIDPRIGQQILSRINPIFAHVTKLDGRATLTVRDLNLPLSNQVLAAGSGSGHLDLQDVRLQPSGVLGELMKLGMVVGPKLYPVQFHGVDFTIANGRINYDNFRIDFLMGYDMIFFGSVGLDDTVSLFVSLPLKPAILDRFDFRPGFLRPSDLLLKNIRIVLPLAGTRQNLMLDLSRENMHRAIRESLKGVIQTPKKDIDDILRPLRPGQRSSTTQPGRLRQAGKDAVNLFEGKF